MSLSNLDFELKLSKAGKKLIAGIDEVGRGPLAGPFVVCALILPPEKLKRLDELLTNNDVINDDLEFYTKIKDSKLLSDKKRREISLKLMNEAITYSVIEISNDELDSNGIAYATQKAFYESIQKLTIRPDHVLTDLFEIKKLAQQNQTNIPGGDRLSITISAASIVAKVYRDNLMLEYDKIYPQYGFAQNKGYGTKQHISAISKYGVSPIHRKSFEPVRSIYSAISDL